MFKDFFSFNEFKFQWKLVLKSYFPIIESKHIEMCNISFVLWFFLVCHSHGCVNYPMQAYASEISNQKYQALGISMVRCSLQFGKHIFISLLQLYFVCLMQAQLCELRNITNGCMGLLWIGEYQLGTWACPRSCSWWLPFSGTYGNQSCKNNSPIISSRL